MTALLAAAFAALAGCGDGAPASPERSKPPLPTLLMAVGPAPLRRLSNVEYLNTLRDLFPSLSPSLPALPADIPVAGFENAVDAQEPSDLLIARYEQIANLYAAAATADAPTLGALSGCSDPAGQHCEAQVVAAAGRRIFRRPLSTAESTRWLAQFQAWEMAVDFAGAAQLTLSAMLQSPQFLYRPEPLPAGARPGTLVPVEPYAMASRLSYLLWESGPDETLLEAASIDALRTEAQVRGQAERMLADPRTKRVLWDFPRQWLGLDKILTGENVSRTAEVDPLWTTTTQASAWSETRLFVESTLAGGGKLGDLLTSRTAWIDGEMARIYGVSTPAAAWTEASLPATERAGLLTRVGFLASASHPGATSPPVRGNAIQLQLLCELPVSPPPGVDLSQPKAPAGQGPQTNRMLFEARTQPAACQTCHRSLNGFGFGLEGYDAAGRLRTTDDGLPVDDEGVIYGTDVDRKFRGGVELSAALAKSKVVHQCATERLVRYALGRPPVTSEQPEVDALATAFLASGGDVRALLVSVASSVTFRTRLVEQD
jgi:hypothetical protein